VSVLRSQRHESSFAGRLPSDLKVRHAFTRKRGKNAASEGGDNSPFAWKPLGLSTRESSYEMEISARRGESRTRRDEGDDRTHVGTTIGNLAEFLQTKESGEQGMSKETLAAGVAAVALAAGIGLASASGISPGEALGQVQHFFTHPQEVLQGVTDSVEAMGPLGPLYFGLIYLVAEVLAVPATPLTLSAGYLFGVTEGTAVVLLSATIAASVAFWVGKTFLRGWVENILKEQPKFAKIDKAIGREGFKLLLLVRLSPIFPFALSNYLYGASSVDFTSYFWGTLLGFAPGTLAYVYTGMVGKALTLGGEADAAQPWYVYAGGLAVLAGLLKLASDVAGGIIDAIDEEENVNDAQLEQEQGLSLPSLPKSFSFRDSND